MALKKPLLSSREKPREAEWKTAFCTAGCATGVIGSGSHLGALGAGLLVIILSVALLVRDKLILPYGINFRPAVGIIIGFVLMVFGMLLSTAIAGAPHYQELVVITLSYASVGALFLFCLLLFSNAQLVWLIKSYMIGVIALAGTGMTLMLLFPDWLSAMGWTNHGARRLTLWMSANTLAAHFALGFCCFLILYRHSLMFQHSRLLAGIAGAFLMMGVFLTGSIAGFVILGVTILVFFVGGLVLEGAVKKNSLYLVFFGGLVFSLFLGELEKLSAYQRIQGWFDNDTLAGKLESGDRLSHWQEGLRLVNQAPLFGSGIESGRTLSEVGFVIHNAFLLIWIEGGVIAILGFFIFLITIIAFSLRLRRRSCVSLLAIVTVMVLYLSVRSHGYQLYLWFPVAVLFALLLRNNREVYF